VGHVVFDQTAAAFAGALDSSIAAGTYRRGDLFLQALRRQLPVGGRVLDYGCGPGRMSRLLARHGYSVVGVDPSAGMIAEAERMPQEGIPLRFRVAGSEGADLDPGAYDAIVCSSVIEYVRDPENLLKNLRRALAPRGVLVLSYSNSLSLWRAYAIRRYRKKLRHLDASYQAWTPGEAARVLARGGFEIAHQGVFFDAPPFDRRPLLRRLSSSRFVGTLGLVTARPLLTPEVSDGAAQGPTRGDARHE
jgi:2-polyprenyl-6-hydroxyphenyl methylase/3-demethylubiquinone-9 3-methyltransferase